jgi:monoamine oxidase
VLEDIDEHKLVLMDQWNSPKMIGREETLAILLNSWCVPCPAGNNVETFRLYEALEAGAVPIIVQEAINSFIAGDMIKISLIFRKPFWRDSGYQGAFQSVEFQGITAVDGSDSTVAYGRLILFIGADQARRLAKVPESNRQTFALELIEKAFPGAKNQFLEYTEGVWVNHPWSGGGYNSYVKYGGNFNAASVLRDYNSDIVFAGSEIAEVFPGYMDGAIRSGMRTAMKLLNA